MNLLTVLVPPREAVTDLAAALENVQPPPGWRKEPPKRWVLPLAAHPHDDLGVRARYLERTLRGAPAPWMRLAGASRDDRACWVRVEAEPERLLRDLVVAAGGDVETFVPTIAVLRATRRTRSAVAPPLPWVHHRGPVWQPREVVLVVWEPARGGGRYVPAHRVPLTMTESNAFGARLAGRAGAFRRPW